MCLSRKHIVFVLFGYVQIAWSVFDEIRKFGDIGTRYGYGSINTTYPDDVVLSLRRAYFASITYVDSLVGQVLDSLTDLGLESNTIVTFVGDHGWQLGEHGEWCKHTNFELATRAPFIVRIPGLTDDGPKMDEFVEFVDIFPTLADAAGLPVPPLCPRKSQKASVLLGYQHLFSACRLVVSYPFLCGWPPLFWLPIGSITIVFCGAPSIIAA